MNSGLVRVLWTMVGQPPTSDWAAAEELLAEQRAAIATCMSNATQPVYGFTTLLGHEDDRPLGEQQQALFEAHLVGPATLIPSRLAQVMLACKIEQLTHGGSGVRPEIFRHLIAATVRDGKPCLGNWRYSYGAGDVVQGAWLVHAVSEDLLQAPADLICEPGDLITLINGTHISTGMASATVVAALHELAQFVQTYRSMVAAAPRGGPQAPVSLRDAEPVLAEMSAALRGAGRELEHRLARPSGNPLFTRRRDGWQAVSQSSFLGLGLTSALTRLQHTLCLTLGVWQRMIAHACTLDGGYQTQLLQPPKIAQAVLESHLLSTVAPTRFTGQDSQGVEDVRDLSLILTRSVAELLPGMTAMRHIWQGLPPDHKPVTAPDLASIEQELLGMVLNSVPGPELSAAEPVSWAQEIVAAWLVG